MKTSQSIVFRVSVVLGLLIAFGRVCLAESSAPLPSAETSPTERPLGLESGSSSEGGAAWSALYQDGLKLVMSRLAPLDRAACTGVCKSWRRAAKALGVPVVLGKRLHLSNRRFSVDGKWILESRANEGLEEVRVFDSSTGGLVQHFQHVLAVSPDDQQIAHWSGSEGISVCSLTGLGEVLHYTPEFKITRGDLKAVFSPDSKRLMLTVYYEKYQGLRQLHLEGDREAVDTYSFPKKSDFSWRCHTSYALEGQRIFVSDGVTTNWLLDLASGDWRQIRADRTRFLPKTNRLLFEKRGRTWLTSDKDWMQGIELYNVVNPWAMQLSPDERSGVENVQDGTVLYDLANDPNHRFYLARGYETMQRKYVVFADGRKILTLSGPGLFVALHPEGKGRNFRVNWVNEACTQSSITSLSLGKREEQFWVCDDRRETFSPDGSVLALEGRNGEEAQLVLWNWVKNEIVKIPLGELRGYAIAAFAFSPDGTRVMVTLAESGLSMIWNLSPQNPSAIPSSASAVPRP